MAQIFSAVCADYQHDNSRCVQLLISKFQCLDDIKSSGRGSDSHLMMQNSLSSSFHSSFSIETGNFKGIVRGVQVSLLLLIHGTHS